MPTVRFTRNIQRHVECPPLEVAGTTVRDVLEEYFASNARARDYVLDERGRLRHHMAAFVAATLNHGHFGVKLHRSRDGGETWSEIAAPKYPDKPADYVPKTPAEGPPVEWALKLVWALTPGGSDEPGVVWCGTLPGGLFKSEDGGDSWTLNHALWFDPRREEWFGGGADQPECLIFRLKPDATGTGGNRCL